MSGRRGCEGATGQWSGGLKLSNIVPMCMDIQHTYFIAIIFMSC